MNSSTKRPALGGILTLGVAIALGVYFTLAAVQGDFGVFMKTQLLAEVAERQAEKARLQAELEHAENLTYRMSDAYLDLDLLDAQARDVLGYVRADEIVIR
ncbi:MAG: FtsB family cell division protein [Paracoccaceae bacterium]